MPTVLIIDDSPTQAAYLRETLQGQSLRIVHRSSAVLGKIGLTAEQVDLVLIALILTDQNGFECGLALRENAFNNIVLYCDCPAASDAEWAIAIGLQGVISIPAPAQTLRRQLSALLYSNSGGNEDVERWAS